MCCHRRASSPSSASPVTNWPSVDPIEQLVRLPASEVMPLSDENKPDETQN